MDRLLDLSIQVAVLCIGLVLGMLIEKRRWKREDRVRFHADRLTAYRDFYAAASGVHSAFVQIVLRIRELRQHGGGPPRITSPNELPQFDDLPKPLVDALDEFDRQTGAPDFAMIEMLASEQVKGTVSAAQDAVAKEKFAAYMLGFGFFEPPSPENQGDDLFRPLGAALDNSLEQFRIAVRTELGTDFS